MKNLVFLFLLFSYATTALSQQQPVDSLLQKLAIEKKDDRKVDLIVDLFLTGLDKDPYLTIQTGQSVLKQGQENNDFIKEASAYEKWVKEKMTEKNNAIRLAAAKKTIVDLEKK